MKRNQRSTLAILIAVAVAVFVAITESDASAYLSNDVSAVGSCP